VVLWHVLLRVPPFPLRYRSTSIQYACINPLPATHNVNLQRHSETHFTKQFLLSLICAASHAHLTGTDLITIIIESLYYMTLSKLGASAEQVQASSLPKHIRSIATLKTICFIKSTNCKYSLHNFPSPHPPVNFSFFRPPHCRGFTITLR
jgi:hypothetical protein